MITGYNTGGDVEKYPNLKSWNGSGAMPIFGIWRIDRINMVKIAETVFTGKNPDKTITATTQP